MLWDMRGRCFAAGAFKPVVLENQEDVSKYEHDDTWVDKRPDGSGFAWRHSPREFSSGHLYGVTVHGEYKCARLRFDEVGLYSMVTVVKDAVKHSTLEFMPEKDRL